MDALKNLPIGPSIQHDDRYIISNGPCLRIMKVEKDDNSLKEVLTTPDLVNGGNITSLSMMDDGDNCYILIGGDNRMFVIVDATTCTVIERFYLKVKYTGILVSSVVKPLKDSDTVISGDTELFAVDKFGDFLTLRVHDLRVLSCTERIRAVTHYMNNPKDTYTGNIVRNMLDHHDDMDQCTTIGSSILKEYLNKTKEDLKQLTNAVDGEDEDVTLELFSKGGNSTMATAIRVKIDESNKMAVVADKDERLMVVSLNKVYHTLSYCLGHSKFVTDMQFVKNPNQSDVLLASIGADNALRFWNPLTGKCLFVQEDLHTLRECPSSSVLTSIQVQFKNDRNIFVYIGDTEGKVISYHLSLNDDDEFKLIEAKLILGETDGKCIQNILLTTADETENDAGHSTLLIIYLNGDVTSLKVMGFDIINDRGSEFIPTVKYDGISENFLKHSYLKSSKAHEEERRNKRQAATRKGGESTKKLKADCNDE